jgi:hypothetical protein
VAQPARRADQQDIRVRRQRVHTFAG